MASISILLFVVTGELPVISRMLVPWRRIAAQPPGPGFGSHAPSVVMITCFIVWFSFHRCRKARVEQQVFHAKKISPTEMLTFRVKRDLVPSGIDEGILPVRT
jgi:hypothetical protein